MTEKRFKLDDFDSDVEMWELLNTQAEIISDLEEENKQLKLRKKLELLDLITYPVYFNSVAVSPISFEHNIYHRTSNQLKNYLKDNGFLIDTVSRSAVGDKSYYNIEINLSDEEWNHEQTNDFAMRKLLGIHNVGLVDFYKRDDIIHKVILIDEKELNDKYLKNGNLVFNND